jgi:hypothetical protein
MDGKTMTDGVIRYFELVAASHEGEDDIVPLIEIAVDDPDSGKCAFVRMKPIDLLDYCGNLKMSHLTGARVTLVAVPIKGADDAFKVCGLKIAKGRHGG